MNFLKQTLLPSKFFSNFSALLFNQEDTNDMKIKEVLQQLNEQYQILKCSIKNIKHQSKYQAYLNSFESLLDYKSNFINKKLSSVMKTLNFNEQRKESKVPLLQAFIDFSFIQRYKFLIDLLKNAEQHQKLFKKKNDSSIQNRYKNELDSLQQKGNKILMQVLISLNDLKAMSLSYWTKVTMEISKNKRLIKVTGKQSFILQIENYLIRLPKKQKNCLVLVCCNKQQVPSWLRKVYIQIKKQAFYEVFQGIWKQVINIQLQKMLLTFDNTDQQSENTHQINMSSSQKKISFTEIIESEKQIHKNNYLTFLTNNIVDNYILEKNKFITKIKQKSIFRLIKRIQFSHLEKQYLAGKLQTLTLSKIQEFKQIYQAKAYFNLTASVVKFKFLDSLKQRNKFITSWQILENYSTKEMQAISQSFDFSVLFVNESHFINPSLFKFQYISLKEVFDLSHDDQTEIIAFQSLSEISKRSVINFMVVQCEKKANQKSELTITCQFSKNFIRKKMKKLQHEQLTRQKLFELTQTIIENWMKEMVFMIFSQQKIYQQKKIEEQIEFFSICQNYFEDVDQLEIESVSSINNEEKIIPQHWTDCLQGQLNRDKKLKLFDQNQVQKLDLSQVNSSKSLLIGERNLQFEKLGINLSQNRQSPLKQKRETKNQLKSNHNEYLLKVLSKNPSRMTETPQLIKKNPLEQDSSF